MVKLKWEEVEALKEIEKYWRDTIADEIKKAAETVGDEITSVAGAFTYAETVARRIK